MSDSGFITTNVDVYGKQEPREIYSHRVSCGDDDGDDSQYRFFITKLKKKNESMYHRNVENKGSWKQLDKGKPVRKGGGVIGYKKKGISYENKNCNFEIYGHWLMKEYQLSDTVKFNDEERRDWVLCPIKKKPRTSTSSSSAAKPIGLNLESAEKLIERMLQRGSEVAEEHSICIKWMNS